MAHPRITAKPSFLHGPFVVVATHGDVVQVVAPPGGFPTIGEAGAFAEHWAEADEASSKEDGGEPTVTFSIENLILPADFKNYMSF